MIAMLNAGLMVGIVILSLALGATLRQLYLELAGPKDGGAE